MDEAEQDSAIRWIWLDIVNWLIKRQGTSIECSAPMREDREALRKLGLSRRGRTYSGVISREILMGLIDLSVDSVEIRDAAGELLLELHDTWDGIVLYDVNTPTL